MPVRKPRYRPLAVTVVTGLALALTACGASNPGVAVRVGDERIGIDRVDEVTDDLCAAFLADPASQGRSFPLRFFRQSVVQQLAFRAIGDQIAEEYDVGPGAEYQTAVENFRNGLEGTLPEEEDVENVIEAVTSEAYRDGVLLALGRQLMRDAGVAPTDEVAAQKGEEFYQAWLTEQGVEIDPRFGMEFRDIDIQAADTQTSYAVSDAARAAQAEEPDPAHTASLPPSQRCG